MTAESLGRVVAAGRTVSFGAAAAGALLGGVLAATAGMRAPFLASGVVAIAATTARLTASRPA